MLWAEINRDRDRGNRELTLAKIAKVAKANWGIEKPLGVLGELCENLFPIRANP